MKAHFFYHILFALAIIAGFSVIVMFLWNILMPEIFGIQIINYWQALGLLILARILMSGIAGDYRKLRGGHGYRNPMHDKWIKMTPEERKNYICHRRGFSAGFSDVNKFEKEL